MIKLRDVHNKGASKEKCFEEVIIMTTMMITMTMTIMETKKAPEER